MSKLIVTKLMFKGEPVRWVELARVGAGKMSIGLGGSKNLIKGGK